LLDKTIREILGGSRTKGDVGIEIECEGRGLPTFIGDSTTWTVVQDGSLRNGGLEYVLRRPIPIGLSKEALDEFRQGLDVSGAVVDMTYRTSVHVHVNFKEHTPRTLFNLITLYGIFESMILEWCGPNRAGNLFCLRMEDAEALVHHYKGVLKRGAIMDLGTPDIRYASLNLKSIMDHGSVEFRGLRGTVDVELIKNWVDFCYFLVQAAESYDDPIQILSQMSGKGPRDFLNAFILASPNPEFTAQMFNRSDVVDCMYSGVRCVQSLAYAIPSWERDTVTGEGVVADDRLAKLMDIQRQRVRDRLDPDGRIVGRDLYDFADEGAHDDFDLPVLDDEE
jgi:hypothetical protein